ncbi:MAG TPA: hypothetical protein VF529_22800 [Solirubrobacteraceae bacterium]|jgi:hypothetical protein
MRRRALLTALLALAAPASAHADGLPVGNVDVGPTGVVARENGDRYVALSAGAGSTVVARIAAGSGEVEAYRWLREPLTIPGVALDGTAGGLSGPDGALVLIRPREHGHYPLRRTRLVVLDAERLNVGRRITLKGDFSYDAISPDGRRLFLVQYVDPDDPRAYVVRTYDLARGKLERGAIVDAREPDEDMRGYPVTRVTTDDGRWAYTLYDGGGEPFVHALDTVERRAFCIDLPTLAGVEDPYTLRLALSGRQLAVEDRGRDAAFIDTTTMEARGPASVFTTIGALAATV